MLCKKENCIGCGVCKAVCPSDAISFVKFKGFSYPSVDFSICRTNDTCAGLCTAACPALSYKISGLSPAMYKAEGDAKGLFALFAEQVLLRGGAVCAPVMLEDLSVQFHIIEDAAQLSAVSVGGALRLFQGDAGDAYLRCRQLLETGRELLFFAPPCMVAGLKSFLSKNYYTLLTIDSICSGAASLLIYADYVSSNSAYHESVEAKLFSSLLFRESCFSCKYARPQRVGDITLGNCAEGSLLSVNSVKGVDSLKAISSELTLGKLDAEQMEVLAPRFFSATERPPLRDAFFADYEKHGYLYVEKKYLRESGLRRFFRGIFKR